MEQVHLVYLTTNLINHKIYIGVHTTTDINDGYMGSGTVLKRAVKKYGRENFNCQILRECNTREEALSIEASMVTPSFCNRRDTYNIAVGGRACLDQSGPKNPMYGKIPTTAKAVTAVHEDGTVIKESSIQRLSRKIRIARSNIRNLINKGIQGRRGWSVTLV